MHSIILCSVYFSRTVAYLQKQIVSCLSHIGIKWQFQYKGSILTVYESPLYIEDGLLTILLLNGNRFSCKYFLYIETRSIILRRTIGSIAHIMLPWHHQVISSHHVDKMYEMRLFIFSWTVDVDFCCFSIEQSCEMQIPIFSLRKERKYYTCEDPISLDIRWPIVVPW